MGEDDNGLEGKGMKGSKQLNVHAATYVNPSPSKNQ